MKCLEIQSGAVFFKLTVLHKDGSRKRHMYYMCQCECGKTISTRGSALLSGNSKSCGCLNTTKGKNIILGYQIPMDGSKIDGKFSPEYNSYRSMKGRCYTKTNKKYKNYGGRGIRICDRWLESFENFYEDMGRRPAHCNSIDRINVNGNYEPGNCRWATEQQQAVNKTNTVRIYIDGDEFCQASLARKIGVTVKAIQYHVGLGKNGPEIIEHYKNKDKNAFGFQRPRKAI